LAGFQLSFIGRFCPSPEDKETIAIAVADGAGGEPSVLATIPNDTAMLLKRLDKSDAPAADESRLVHIEDQDRPPTSVTREEVAETAEPHQPGHNQHRLQPLQHQGALDHQPGPLLHCFTVAEFPDQLADGARGHYCRECADATKLDG